MVDLAPFLACGPGGELSGAALAACAAVAVSLRTTSALLVRDPRVREDDNAAFVDAMERCAGRWRWLRRSGSALPAPAASGPATRGADGSRLARFPRPFVRPPPPRSYFEQPDAVKAADVHPELAYQARKRAGR